MFWQRVQTGGAPHWSVAESLDEQLRAAHVKGKADPSVPAVVDRYPTPPLSNT